MIQQQSGQLFFNHQGKKDLSFNKVNISFVMLYKVVLTFESVDEILKCDYSNESY